MICPIGYVFLCGATYQIGLNHPLFVSYYDLQLCPFNLQHKIYEYNINNILTKQDEETCACDLYSSRYASCIH